MSFEPMDFQRYLSSKRTVDDRALNRAVWHAMAEELERAAGGKPRAVLEIGCGTGTMLERIVEWGLRPIGSWTGMDADAASIAQARATLPGRLARLGVRVEAQPPGLRIIGPGTDFIAELAAADIFPFARAASGKTWDLLLAHAFIDLVDVAGTLPLLFSLLPPGGLFAFTVVFDGVTLFEPPISAELDERIEGLYHRTMDERVVDGRRSGDSRTGRHLFGHMQRAGARVLAAGSSDWVVFPIDGAYPGDEAYFLHFIVETVRRALSGSPELQQAELDAWTATRHAQVDQGRLVYIAHQLDVVGRTGAGR